MEAQASDCTPALATGEPELGGLVSYGFSRLALEAISVGQILLAALMALSVLASVVMYLRRTDRPQEPSQPGAHTGPE